VAQAVAMLLEAIDEPECGDCADGFRPGRGPPQALQEGRQGWRKHGMGSVIDWDISACCDHLQHETLVAILRKRVQDGRVLADIELWLHAGLLDGQERVCPEQGSPQGSVRSPL